jgi:hypothetical protein
MPSKQLLPEFDRNRVLEPVIDFVHVERSPGTVPIGGEFAKLCWQRSANLNTGRFHLQLRKSNR